MGNVRAQAWYRGDAFRLLLILVAVYLVGAFMGGHRLATPLVNLATGTAVLVTVHRIAGGTVFRVILVVLAALFVVGWILHERAGSSLDWWNTAGGLGLLLFVQVILLRSVFAREPVTADKIFAAACAYLLLGLCWGFAYRLVHAADPQAFTLSANDLTDTAAALSHFSFTALTTVGYGAISPVSRTARALADVEALVGQLYVAIVIARLVALQITQSSADGNGR